MVVDTTHPGEGHPVQRRVSYRRLNEEEHTEGGGVGDNLSVHQTRGGILSKSGLVLGMNAGDSRGGGDDMDAYIAGADNPASIWHEIWLAVRCVVCVAGVLCSDVLLGLSAVYGR